MFNYQAAQWILLCPNCDNAISKHIVFKRGLGAGRAKQFFGSWILFCGKRKKRSLKLLKKSKRNWPCEKIQTSLQYMCDIFIFRSLHIRYCLRAIRQSKYWTAPTCQMLSPLLGWLIRLSLLLSSRDPWNDHDIRTYWLLLRGTETGLEETWTDLN